MKRLEPLKKPETTTRLDLQSLTISKLIELEFTRNTVFEILYQPYKQYEIQQLHDELSLLLLLYTEMKSLTVQFILERFDTNHHKGFQDHVLEFRIQQALLKYRKEQSITKCLGNTIPGSTDEPRSTTTSFGDIISRLNHFIATTQCLIDIEHKLRDDLERSINVLGLSLSDIPFLTLPNDIIPEDTLQKATNFVDRKEIQTVKDVGTKLDRFSNQKSTVILAQEYINRNRHPPSNKVLPLDLMNETVSPIVHQEKSRTKEQEELAEMFLEFEKLDSRMELPTKAPEKAIEPESRAALDYKRSNRDSTIVLTKIQMPKVPSGLKKSPRKIVFSTTVHT